MWCKFGEGVERPQKTLSKTLASKVALFQDLGRKLVSFAASCSNTSFSDLRLDMQGIASRIAGRIGLAIKPRCSSDLGVSTVTLDPLMVLMHTVPRSSKRSQFVMIPTSLSFTRRACMLAQVWHTWRYRTCAQLQRSSGSIAARTPALLPQCRSQTWTSCKPLTSCPPASAHTWT